MNANTLPPGAIVAGIDGSESAEQALLWAVRQADLDGQSLILAHAIPPLASTWLDVNGMDTRIGVDDRRSSHLRLLDQAHALVSERAPALDVHEVVRTSEPHVLLSELGNQASVVVIGSRGRGPIRSALLGSVGRALTRHPRCTVVVHRPRPPGASSSEVLVGVDGSVRSLPVLEFAFRLADQRGLSLRLLHCYVEEPTAALRRWAAPGSSTATSENNEVAAWLGLLMEKHGGVPVAAEVAHQLPQQLLSAMSGHEGMIVLGGHRPSVAVLPVSVTAYVLERAQCPVAVVPVEA